MKRVLLTLFPFYFLSLTAQELPVAADYSGATKLNFNGRKCVYGPTVAPKGFGKKNEFKACDKQDIYTFEKEHNSAWYIFSAPEDGNLLLEIIPENPKNDYDFMLFRWKDTSFATELSKKNILPARTNLARCEKTGTSSTGLSFFASRDQVPVGPGESFSKPLRVRKGEKYVLILDNVTPKGKGHTISMQYLRDITLSGKVQDENKRNLVASVSVEDRNDHIIARTTTDSSGNYHLAAEILDADSYTLILDNDSSFASCMDISAPLLSKTNYELKDIKTTLKHLSAGKKFVLDAVYFHNGTEQLLPASAPALSKVIEMMNKNKKMSIQIEGHVNNKEAMPNNTGADHQKGEEKAKAIFDYLRSKGITKERMSFISYGSLYMIYPKPTSEKEAEANERIEIFITSK